LRTRNQGIAAKRGRDSHFIRQLLQLCRQDREITEIETRIYALLRMGALVRESTLRSPNSEHGSESQITRLLVPTANRSDVLARCLTSIGNNLERCKHNCMLVVSDQSMDAILAP
jgi:hypothetical protein